MSNRNLKRKDIAAYRVGAIVCLKEQLKTATTESKKTKLLARIAKWESQDENKNQEA